MAGIGPSWLVNTELGASVIETITERRLMEVGLAALTGGAPIAAAILQNAGGPEKVPGFMKDLVLNVIGESEQVFGAAIFQSFVDTALGVKLSDTSGQEAQAVRMIERAIGFGAGMPLVTGPLSGWLQAKFGNHAPKDFIRGIKEIPHDIGMSFFLGTTLASIFEIATSGPIGEAIREQTRPSRLEWPQIARLLKAKQIDESVAFDYLRKAGFRDQDIPTLQKLDNQLLSFSQIQMLHDIGYLGDGDTLDYLGRLGFDPVDTQSALQLFKHQAATEGATSFRTVARNAYLNTYLSEPAYRGLLESVETPPESIDLLVAGVQLERDAGRLHLTIAEIKSLYDNQHLSLAETEQRLGVAGLNEQDIADLLKTWQDGKKVARTGISSAKIIAYLLGGVIDKKTAYDRLVVNGMKQADAQFLVDHPSTHPQVAIKPVSKATIVAAFKDDVLTIDEARAALRKANVPAAEIELLLANANFSISKGKKPKQPTKTLSEGHVLDAIKLGLATPAWGERELETLGWAAADASLIVMIELARLDSKNIALYGWQQLT